MKIKDKLIKLLGGYTEKEHLRVERKYQALLDSKSTEDVSKIVNEHIYRLLKSLDSYSKTLYGILPDVWAKKMYNVIHNNFLRIVVRYLHTGSNIIYTFDTTLDGDKEFEKILKSENKDIDNFFILETD